MTAVVLDKILKANFTFDVSQESAINICSEEKRIVWFRGFNG
jgi:hypothetical protein